MKWYRAVANDLSLTLFSKPYWILSPKAIVDLKKNLNVLFGLMNISIPSVDKTGNGRLRLPCNSLVIDRALNSVKDIHTVSEDILDIVLTVDIRLNAVLPCRDLRELTIIPSLNALNFLSNKTDAPGHSRSCAKVVGSVAESFEHLVRGMELINGWVTIVFLGDFDIGL